MKKENSNSSIKMEDVIRCLIFGDLGQGQASECEQNAEKCSVCGGVLPTKQPNAGNIKFDFRGMIKFSSGESNKGGFKIETFGKYLCKALDAQENVLTQGDSGMMGWANLCESQAEVVEEINAYAKQVREKFESFVVLGIGGSALGARVIFEALCHNNHNLLSKEKRGNAPKFFVEDNVDPERLSALLDCIDLRTTIFNVVTKSGTTTEIMAQFMLVYDLVVRAVGKEKADAHFVFTTDAEKGYLNEFNSGKNIKTFYIPSGVGGRFSVLSPVGLLPASVLGVDIGNMLKGASDMSAICRKSCKDELYGVCDGAKREQMYRRIFQGDDAVNANCSCGGSDSASCEDGESIIYDEEFYLKDYNDNNALDEPLINRLRVKRERPLRNEHLCLNETLRKLSVMKNNPALMKAILQYIGYQNGQKIIVTMPYAQKLGAFSSWYAQLLGESLGKKYDLAGNVVNVGLTPVSAIGVTDQHSQQQLYIEGENDKIVTFIRLSKFATSLSVPKDFTGLDSLDYLKGVEFGELVDVECSATEYALTKNGRLNNEIVLPCLDEYYLGQLFVLAMYEIVYLGQMLNVNAFDQPGVEDGKIATFKMLKGKNK